MSEEQSKYNVRGTEKLSKGDEHALNVMEAKHGEQMFSKTERKVKRRQDSECVGLTDNCLLLSGSL